MRVGVLRLALYVVSVTAIVILANFGLELLQSSDDRARGVLKSETAKFTHEATHAVSLVINSVSSVGALFESSQQVDEREFARYVIRSQLVSEYTHADTISVMPLLREDELSAFRSALEARRQQRIDSGYPPDALNLVAGQAVYAPQIYAEPADTRSPLQGFDLASDPVLLNIARAALVSSHPHMTAPLTARRDTVNKTIPVLIIGAVKNAGNLGLRAYKTASAERTLFIAASFTPTRLFDQMLHAIPGSKTFALRVADITESTSYPVYTSDGLAADMRPFSSERLVLGNRVWQFDYFPRPGHASDGPKRRFIFLGVLGGLLTLALTIALDRLIKARGALERLVGERAEQLRTLNQALAESARQASAENDAKSLFLAHMSHELRTPLNAVIGYAQMLSSEIFGPLGNTQYIGYAKTIEDAGKMQLQLVEDILALTALQADKRELDRIALDLNEVAEKCIDIVRTRAAEKNIRLSTHSLLGRQPFWCDERSIQQILLNLLSNAIKFTPNGGEITIRLTRDNLGTTSIIVEDNGIGIAPENLDRVLQPFSQANRNAYNAYEGVGLGLSIVSGLVKICGGTVRLESEVGKGTVVIVEFPVATQSNPASGHDLP